MSGEQAAQEARQMKAAGLEALDKVQETLKSLVAKVGVI